MFSRWFILIQLAHALIERLRSRFTLEQLG